MTGIFSLDWSVLTISLFNMILLIWLGLTVLLNAERHTVGLWATGGGLLSGGLFFLGHSILVGYGLSFFSQGLNFWWRLSWIPLVILPFAWYGIILWFCGFWNNSPEEKFCIENNSADAKFCVSMLRRRHRGWFGLTLAISIGTVLLLTLSNPLPSASQLLVFDLKAYPAISGFPLLILAYPAYSLLCTGLSLDALRHPNPSERVMGDLARQRARPWLFGASLLLALVSVIVGSVIIWLASVTAFGGGYAYSTNTILTVSRLDLLLAGLIAGVILLSGQAIVAYEIFTGKTLPRRGLARYWKRAVILAAGYSLLVSAGLNLSLRPIYNVLLATLLLTGFYALVSWKDFEERERTMQNLRPFVASQGLYEHMLAHTSDSAADSPGKSPGKSPIIRPFQALCRDVLETRAACLLPLGSYAALTGPALIYTEGDAVAAPPSQALANDLANLPGFNELCLPLNPEQYAPYQWAVPLWGEGGLMGVLFLAEQRDESLYTQEEIEIARSTGERLLDAQASAEMARRLVRLQRQRLAESQMIDQRARRRLHDDILPELHTAMLALSATNPPPESPAGQALQTMAAIHRQIAELLRALPAQTPPELSRLGLLEALKRQVLEGELQGVFEPILWQVSEEAQKYLNSLPSLPTEVLFYAAREALRNAARYAHGGDESKPIGLTIRTECTADELLISIEDSGSSMEDVSASSAPAGAGQGLALHSTLMAVIGGSLSLESIPAGSGHRQMLPSLTRLTLRLPRQAWDPDALGYAFSQG